MKNFFTLAAMVIVAASCVVTAQQQEPSLKPSVSQREHVPTKLLLEVTYNRQLPPAYSTVNGAEEKAKWIWVTRFARIPGRESPPPRIGAVRLESQFNGETADVRVTLLRGSQGFDQEDLVGVYRLGVGEQKTIGELVQHGIEPFNITLLNTVPPLPPSPGFENLTKAIEIASVQLENIPNPAYRVTLRNLSDKNVWAVKVEIFSDSRSALTTLLQGEEGDALLKPGGVVEGYLPAVRAVQSPTGYAPGTAAANIISIRSVVFTDLTFEGDSGTACMMESFVMGRRLWLKQVLSLLEQELSKTNADHIEAAKQFKEKFAALSYDLDESERNKLSVVARTCPRPSHSSFMATQGLKLQLLRELDQIIKDRPVPPLNFKSWLEEKRTRYSAWLARLSV